MRIRLVSWDICAIIMLVCVCGVLHGAVCSSQEAQELTRYTMFRAVAVKVGDIWWQFLELWVHGWS